MRQKTVDLLTSSIFRRLLFSYLITVLVGLGVVGLLLALFTKDYIYDTKKEELLRLGKQINSSIQSIDSNDQRLQETLAFFDLSYNKRIWLFDTTGKIVENSTKDEVFVGQPVAASVVAEVMQGKNVVQDLKFEGMETPMLSAVVPWGKEDKIFGGIVLHDQVAGWEKAVSRMREAILWATLLGVLLSTLMVSILSWSISRPLRRMEAITSEIGKGNYEQRIDVDTKDEIGDLARSINEMAQQLRTVDEYRQALEQRRSEFMLNISHELRTPLTAMQGFLEALQDGLVEEEPSKQKYYQVMYQETLFMARLLEDLSDLNRLQQEEVALNRYPTQLEEVLKRVLFTFRGESEEKGIPLHLEIGESLSKVLADPIRLEQIFSNLVQNALKFTQEGFVSLRAWEEGDYVVVSVEDTGIGISEEELPRIWERFFKVDRGRSRKNRGSGLGLAIVKKLVELHRGSITVQSEPGKGTSFFVKLPSCS